MGCHTGYMYEDGAVRVLYRRDGRLWRIRTMSMAADAFLDHLQDGTYLTLAAARVAVEEIYPHMQRIAHYRIDSPPLFVSRSVDGWKVSFACDPRTLIDSPWTTDKDAELVSLKNAAYPSRKAAVDDVCFWIASSAVQ